jgi:hypothetical protein
MSSYATNAQIYQQHVQVLRILGWKTKIKRFITKFLPKINPRKWADVNRCFGQSNKRNIFGTCSICMVQMIADICQTDNPGTG